MSVREYDDISESIVKIMIQHHHDHISQNEARVISHFSTLVSSFPSITNNIIVIVSIFSKHDQQHHSNSFIILNRFLLPEDYEELIDLHCFVHSNLLELFVVPPLEEPQRRKRKHAYVNDI